MEELIAIAERDAWGCEVAYGLSVLANMFGKFDRPITEDDFLPQFDLEEKQKEHSGPDKIMTALATLAGFRDGWIN